MLYAALLVAALCIARLYMQHYVVTLHIAGFPLVGKNNDKSPLTKILSLPINVPLHLVCHPLPSISQSPPIIWYI